ncbi:MAG: hypothetical protein SFU83_21220 [Meiothermus sp.]|nr:hypothetical protein [Meiothermus sp.]
MKHILTASLLALGLVGMAQPLAQNRNLPTEFPIDCRGLDRRPASPAEATQNWNWRCQRVSEQWGKGARFGAGIGPAQLASGFPTMPGTVRYFGGFLDNEKRKLYIGATWSDNRGRDGNPDLKNFGLIFEVDIDWKSENVGSRKVISGKYLSRQGDVDVGSGDKLSTVKTLRRGKDGNLYAFTQDAGNPATVVRIDPASGSRTTVWSEKAILHNNPNPFPKDQCENGQVVGKDGITGGGRRSVQINGLWNPFEMNPQTGEFYLSVIQADRNSPFGIIKIGADGSECSWVTRAKAGGSNRYADNATTKADPTFGQPAGVGTRGAGITNMTFNATNLFYHEVKGQKWLYASSGSTYWRTNLETGNRELVVQADVGDSYSVWDATRNWLWTSGTGNGSAIGAVTINNEDDPKVSSNLFCTNPGAAWYQCVRGPGEVGPMLRGGMFVDPLDGNLIIAHDAVGLVRIEVKTGNSYTFSL